MCLPQTISDFPEGQFQILIWTVASEQSFGVRTFPELARPCLPERPRKRLYMLMRVLNLLASYNTEQLCD